MGHGSLLKAVLTKSTATMAGRGIQSKSLAIYVCGLANQYCRVNSGYNTNQMNAFLAAVREVAGDASGSVSVDSSETDVRSHLEGTIPSLLSALQLERPATYATLSAIDWRRLFSIEPEAPVKLVVVPGSDDDSGGASLGDATSST